MVCVCFFGAVVHVHVVVLLQVGQAEAACVLATAVVCAGAATAETILCALNSFTQNHAVDEPKIFGEDIAVYFVDDRDRNSVLGWQRAQLTPMAVLSWTSWFL